MRLHTQDLINKLQAPAYSNFSQYREHVKSKDEWYAKFIKELIFMVIISHENILKFSLKTTTCPQKWNVFQIFLYNNIYQCLCSLFSLKSLTLTPTTHSSSYHQILIPAWNWKVMLDSTFLFTPSFTMSNHSVSTLQTVFHADRWSLITAIAGLIKVLNASIQHGLQYFNGLLLSHNPMNPSPLLKVLSWFIYSFRKIFQNLKTLIPRANVKLFRMTYKFFHSLAPA